VSTTPKSTLSLPEEVIEAILGKARHCTEPHSEGQFEQVVVNPIDAHPQPLGHFFRFEKPIGTACLTRQSRLSGQHMATFDLDTTTS
jgi:hypothetical protein